jgi:ferritin
LKPIDAVKTSWETPLEAFKDTLEHEKKVTSLIHNLYEIAVEDKDYASQSMLKWFIDEQVEEEESAFEIIESLNRIGDNSLGLYMIDKDLAARVYTTPSPLAGKE